MDKKAILDYVNANLSGFIATVDDGKPHVRGVMFYRADENGIIFHTGKTKDLHKQLQKNPNVEMCFVDMKDFKPRLCNRNRNSTQNRVIFSTKKLLT